MNKFDFETQLEVGQNGEDYLDAYYAPRYDIRKATDIDLQKRGVDRLFKSKDSNLSCWFTVEYKVDFKAGETGNVFLEIEVSSAKKKGFGWVQKLFAQSLIYYVPKLGTAFYCNSLLIKNHVERWALEHKISRLVMNKGQANEFWSLGILVPIDVFARAVCLRKDVLREV